MKQVSTRILVGLGGVLAGVYLAPFALVASIAVLIGRGITVLCDSEFVENEIIPRFLIVVFMIIILYFCFMGLAN